MCHSNSKLSLPHTHMHIHTSFSPLLHPAPTRSDAGILFLATGKFCVFFGCKSSHFSSSIPIDSLLFPSFHSPHLPLLPSFLPSSLPRCFRLCLPCRPRARGTRRKKEEGEAPPAALNLPIIDYLFQTMDASALAQEFISAFRKIHAEGHVARERVLVALCVMEGQEGGRKKGTHTLVAALTHLLLPFLPFLSYLLPTLPLLLTPSIGVIGRPAPWSWVPT